MPSRAVLRKKARREAKQKKEATEGVKKTFVPALHRLDISADASTTGATAAPAFSSNARENYVLRRRPVTSSAASAAAGGTDSAAEAAEALEVVDTSSMTRKERKKHEAKVRLERQLDRLARSRVNAPVVTDGEGGPGDAEAAVEAAAAASGPAMRHHPRFANGTYWKQRKERRARSLFCGGVPLTYTEEQVKDLVLTVLDSSDGAQEHLSALNGAPAIEEVDFLPAKHSKVRNMYLLMASVPIAGYTAQLLDGYPIQGKKIRCNFASDKNQRAEAIRKREQ